MDFQTLTDKVISYLEGGYYHPDMKASLKNGDKMGKSGETLFGLDRTWGGTDITTGTGAKFWTLVDQIYGSHHADTAYYNNKPTGSNYTTLRNYVAQIMQARYEKYSGLYLTAKSKALLSQYPALAFNFLYACWNGSGYFQTFAKAFNAAVSSGVTSEAKLLRVCYDARKASTLASTADKVETAWNTLTTTRMSGSSRRNVIWWVLLAAGVASYFLLKNGND